MPRSDGRRIICFAQREIQSMEGLTHNLDNQGRVP